MSCMKLIKPVYLQVFRISQLSRTYSAVNCLRKYNRITNIENRNVFAQKPIVCPCSVPNVRFYAKGKDKKKEKGKKKVEINENILNEVVNVESLKQQMQKVVDTLKDDYIKNLSLRSTTGAIEMIPVSVDGKEYTLQELAQIIRKNPKTIVLNMGMFPQTIPAALKAISKSGMNLNPQQDGNTLYIPVPKVTKEHREQLAKNAKTLFVKCRDSVRDIQNKQTKSLKKKEHFSEDVLHSVQEQIVTMADQYIAQAEKILESKQNELVGSE